MGDRVITRQALYDDSGRRIGSLFTDCVNVGPKAKVFRATLQCMSVYRIQGGQVVSEGVVKLGSSSGSIAIVGGAGAYSSASGEVGAGAPVKGYDTVDVLHLDG
jgi:hypothetical protein